MTDFNPEEQESTESELPSQQTQPMLPQETMPSDTPPDLPELSDETEDIALQDTMTMDVPPVPDMEHTQPGNTVPAPPPPTMVTQPIQPVGAPIQAGSPKTQPMPAYQPPPGHQPPHPGYAPPRRMPPPRRRRRFGCGGCFLFFMMMTLVLVVIASVAGLIVVKALSVQLEDGLAQLEQLDQRQAFQTTVIYDRNGETLYEVFDEGRRTNITLEELPDYVKWAAIAIEDDSFYSNMGVDIGSVIRAAYQNISGQYDLERPIGASTITQQLVRNIAFDYEYRTAASYQRKIEEVILSMILTSRMSKDDILELYLNEIYYGNLAYGIEAASQAILGKPASELTLGEAAMLAGLPQAPGELDPLNPDPVIQQAILDRRRLVIDLMLDKGFITEEEAYSAYGESLSYANPDVPLVAPHFTVAARDELEAVLAMMGYAPDFITAGGLQVYTSLDLRFQDLAERTAQDHVASLRAAHNLTNASVVVLHPFTGEVLAMVGSVDYWDDNIDGRVNVALAPRQPGSTMKPFTYASAFEQGWSPANIIWDTETHIGVAGQAEYVPVNYDNAFHGPVRVRDALANSYNIPAVQTLRVVGVPYLLTMMQRVGVESLGNDASYYGLSLTLGGGEVTLLELSRAYGAFANGGLHVPSTMIRCVLDSDDNIIYQYENGCPYGEATGASVNVLAYGAQAMDERVAFMISDILADNPSRTPAMGANSPLNTGELRTSVKTGTTNDTRDNWTVGYTRNVVVGVWAGNSDNTPMVNTSGLTGAAPIWNEVINGIYNNPDLLAVLAQDGQLVPDYWTPPSGLSRQHVCAINTLQDPSQGCPNTEVEWFLDGPALVPDGIGNMVSGSTHLAPPLMVADPNANGPQLAEPERGLYQAIVKSLSPEMGQLALASLQLAPGVPAPPAPRYCLVPNEVVSQVTGISQQLFIGPPFDPTDETYAHHWAQARNVPILPWVACTPEMLLASQDAVNAGAPVVEAFISAPAPGQSVSGDIQIVGTANFTQQQALYYKLELRGGPNFPNWVTLGEVHSAPVVNGQLEVLGASGLPTGTYFLRLVIVGLDGNYLQNPYEVSFVKP